MLYWLFFGWRKPFNFLYYWYDYANELVAKNAILLVDFTNKLKEEGMSIIEALVEAGKERLRPILMTTIAMVFGMLPLAFATSASSENRNGLAWVIIGGLLSSLILTLVLVPSVYLIMEKVKNRFWKKKVVTAGEYKPHSTGELIDSAEAV